MGRGICKSLRVLEFGEGSYLWLPTVSGCLCFHFQNGKKMLPVPGKSVALGFLEELALAPQVH